MGGNIPMVQICGFVSMSHLLSLEQLRLTSLRRRIHSLEVLRVVVSDSDLLL